MSFSCQLQTSAGGPVLLVFDADKRLWQEAVQDAALATLTQFAPLAGNHVRVGDRAEKR